MTVRVLLLSAALTLTACVTHSSTGPRLSPREEAIVLLKKGDAKAAVEKLEKLFKESPQDLELARALCEARVQEGTQEQLLTRLSSQSTPISHYMRGLILFASAADATGPAIEAFRKAQELAPDEPEYHYRLGVALLESEKDAEAIVPLKKALAMRPQKSSWNLPLAKALFRTGDQKAAITCLRQFIEGAPSPQEVTVAQSLMEKATDPFAQFPSAARARVEQGMQWLQVSDVPQQAIVEFETVLRDYPDLAVVHTLLGLAYQRLDDAGRAVEEFKRAIELAPDDGKNHFYLGELYWTRQRASAAMEHYQKAVERNPLLTEAWGRLGDLALQRADPQAAGRCFRTVVLLDPRSNVSRAKLALTYQLQEDWPGAERELKVVVDKEPENLEFVLRLGILNAEHFKRARTPGEKEKAAKEAEVHLKKILEAQPDNALASAALQVVRGQ
jgi:tetratricopeptide (TPR) repeat protein